MTKVIISSVITGFEAQREAVSQAIVTLGHRVIRAEDFGIRPDSPQRACLGELRDSDLVVLVIGARYGAVQERSGLSATHEEFREAAANKPLLVFVEEDIEREGPQHAFLEEVRDWASGKLTGSFTTPDELQRSATRAIHDWEVRQARGTKSSPEEIFARAADAGAALANRPELMVALAFGPATTLIATREFEIQTTAERIYDRAIAVGLFRKMARVETEREGGVLQLSDERIRIRLAQDGTMAIGLDPTIEQSDRAGLPAIVDEDLTAKLATALRFASALIEEIDPTERAGDVAGFASLREVGWLPWRTAAEYQATGGSGTMNARGESEIRLQLPETPNKRSTFFYRTQHVAEELVPAQLNS